MFSLRCLLQSSGRSRGSKLWVGRFSCRLLTPELMAAVVPRWRPWATVASCWACWRAMGSSRIPPHARRSCPHRHKSSSLRSCAGLAQLSWVRRQLLCLSRIRYPLFQWSACRLSLLESSRHHAIVRDSSSCQCPSGSVLLSFCLFWVRLKFCCKFVYWL